MCLCVHRVRSPRRGKPAVDTEWAEQYLQELSSENVVAHLGAHLRVPPKVVPLHGAGVLIVCGGEVRSVFGGREALLRARPAVLEAAVLVVEALAGEAGGVAGLHPGGGVVAGGGGGGGERVLRRVAAVVRRVAERQQLWRGAGSLEEETPLVDGRAAGAFYWFCFFGARVR